MQPEKVSDCFEIEQFLAASSPEADGVCKSGEKQINQSRRGGDVWGEPAASSDPSADTRFQVIPRGNDSVLPPVSSSYYFDRNQMFGIVTQPARPL